MICNKCGKEFGNGSTCQNCGVDKVIALGVFSGYSVPGSNGSTPMPQSSPSSSIPPFSSMICWKCGEVIPSESKFCPRCREELFVYCPKCGHKYSAQYTYCNQCGADHEGNLKEKEPRRQPEKEWHPSSLPSKKEEKPVEKPDDPAYVLAYAYVKKMAIYFELETFFVNLAYTVKLKYLEQYLFEHQINDRRVDNIVGAIIKDKTYWKRRDCLDSRALEEECVLAYMFVNETIIAVF